MAVNVNVSVVVYVNFCRRGNLAAKHAEKCHIHLSEEVEMTIQVISEIQLAAKLKLQSNKIKLPSEANFVTSSLLCDT